MRHKKILIVALTGLTGMGGLFLLYFCYPVWHRFFPICPTYQFLHIYCPGCGTTRALYCLLHGNLAGSLGNNFFLIPTVIIAGLLGIFPKLLRHTKLINAYIIIVFLYGILRNIPCYPFTLLIPVGI